MAPLSGKKPARAQAAPRQPIGKRVENVLRHLEERAMASGRRRVRIPFYLARVLVQVVQQWARDRCPQQAASLAYQTILSVVPVLAVATAALRALGYFDAESSFVNFIADHLIPVSKEELSEHLADYSKNISFETLGLVGLITSVFLAFVMFNNLEKITNYIWRAEQRRSITQKFVVFYFSMTVGPLLLGTSLVQAARYGLTSGFSGVILGVGSSFAVVLLANLFVPITKVQLKPALIGAALTTVLFEVGKLGFSYYVAQFALDRYSGVYGAIAIIPIWLVWIYYSWLTLLLGVEVAHAVQHLDALEAMDRRGRVSLQNEILRRVNGVVAARIMVAVVSNYEEGGKVTSRPTLADRFDLSDYVVDRIIERLADADLLIEVEGKSPGVIPARPPNHVALSEVLQAFRGDDVAFKAPNAHRSKLDRVLAEIDRDTNERTSGLSLEELASMELATAGDLEDPNQTQDASAEGVDTVSD